MNAILPADIVVELESAIAGRPPDRRVRMLWRTTDLLVASRERLGEQEIDLLDEVLIRLSEHIEPEGLAKLSAVLADLPSVPKETLRRLALHEDPAIAGPLLLKSEAVTAHDLRAVATNRGEPHLLAIAGRRTVDQALSDILLRRGSKNVCRVIVRNPGAQLSESGYAAFLAKADGDGEITEALALRPDIPETTLRTLISKASKEVKVAILDALPEGRRERLDADALPSVQAPGTKQRPAPDYSEARSEVAALSRIGKLNDSTVNRFAIRGEKANLIASLSVLSGAPVEIIERVMAAAGYEGLVMACHGSRLNWQTTLAILGNRGGPQLSANDRVRAQELFETQYLSTSQWMVRWGDMPAAGEAANGNIAKSGAKR
jgi:uncharacterized protein (DUF2336 family)